MITFKIKMLLLVTTVFFCFSMPVYAYLDPGTGSLIIQSIIGAIAALAVTFKIYWHKLKVFFIRKKDDSE